MSRVMAGRSGCMPSMNSSIDPTLADTFAFAHGALANQVFSHDSLPQQNFSAPQNYPAHGKVAYLHKTCAECLSSFPTNSNLEQHASSSGHTAFSCACGAQFSRAYTLTRHINSMIGPSFPCELCDDKVFPRLDKLCDHLRRWHRLGARAFDQYKGGSSSPGSASPPNGGISPIRGGGGALGQGYPVATGFGPMSMLDDFSTHAAPDASSARSSTSPGSSTGADNWWYSQPGPNTVYPS